MHVTACAFNVPRFGALGISWRLHVAQLWHVAGDPSYQFPETQEVELCYVVFDILHYKNRSLLNLPLSERQKVRLGVCAQRF